MISSKDPGLESYINYPIENWGLIDYAAALEKQLETLEKISSTETRGCIIFCSHPEVVTTGRATQAGDVFDWHGPLVEISRGGRATYHGPSQLMIYPIINLNFASEKRKAKDIASYLRNLEQAIVETLAEYQIQATGKSLQLNPLDSVKSEETGVWVKDKKIASIGVAVKKWVSYHGAAINLDIDPQAFQGLKPCGFSKDIMTSMENFLQKKINRSDFTKRLSEKLNHWL